MEELRPAILDLLHRHAQDPVGLGQGLERLALERDVRPHAALILLLTRLPFEESEARAHWRGIADRQHELARLLGREPDVRVAALDYFQTSRSLLRDARIVDLDFERIDPAPLASERAFRNTIEREVRRARRHGEGLAVVLFDLDDFAALARRGGAAMGDRLLGETALLLVNQIRAIDLAASPGEDELAVLLPSTDRRGALTVAERFRHEVERFFGSRDVAGQPAGLTVSAGVAVCPEDAPDADRLVRRAAQALYVAKAKGKNQVAT
jgi:diguanylate cyclase (GGDEF)-like protein